MGGLYQKKENCIFKNIVYTNPVSHYGGAMSGIFITFEGIEGSGKSTQIKRLHDYLVHAGYQTVITREPGGTAIGDEIRQILLNTANTAMTPVTELLLYVAARAQHAAERIRPAIASGHIVLCDRYADATSAYQGAARAIKPDTLRYLHQLATHNLTPDITFLLDLPVDAGLERAAARSASGEKKADRLDQETRQFHARVREGYLAIASQERERFRIIDATQSIDTIYNDIVHHVVQYLGTKSSH